MSPDQLNNPEVTDGMARRCPVCETVFTVATAKSRQVYCSPACCETHRKSTPLRRDCLACGNEFTTSTSARRSYCSRQCRLAARDGALEERTCPVCETVFDAPTTIRQTYCTASCRRVAERKRGQERDAARARRLGDIPPPPARPELPPPPKPAVHATKAARQLQPARDPLEPTATRDCPHCKQPITIVALLATPEAARPALPPRPDVIPMRRLP